jgi:hypothetical protein
MESFNDFFGALQDEFRSNGTLDEIRNAQFKIPWGEGHGVYTIWHNKIDVDYLIYVGLTGKYKRGECGKKAQLNDGRFKKRSGRWTPYRFCESKKDHEDIRFSFRYGPKFNNVKEQGRHKYDNDAYRTTIPYNQLLIVTLDLTGNMKYSPALLESLILTRYLAETGDLPPANNEL